MLWDFRLWDLGVSRFAFGFLGFGCCFGDVDSGYGFGVWVGLRFGVKGSGLNNVRAWVRVSRLFNS